jgi:hypothetical protein
MAFAALRGPPHRPGLGSPEHVGAWRRFDAFEHFGNERPRLADAAPARESLAIYLPKIIFDAMLPKSRNKTSLGRCGRPRARTNPSPVLPSIRRHAYRLGGDAREG